MRQVLPPHHSVGDWDIQGAYIYSIDHFVSPPTSFSCSAGVAQVICKHPNTLVIPSGEIRLHLWEPAGTYISICFRRQDPIGTPTVNPKTYRIYQRGTPFFDTVLLYDSFPAPALVIGSWPYQWPFNAWVEVRVQFWTFNGGDPANPLAVNLYIKEAGVWVKKGDTLFYSPNTWVGTDPCRVGFTVHEGAWVDDIEIWKKI